MFLNSPLSHIAAQILNKKIRKLIEDEGFICIFPQEILPPRPETKSKDVLERNARLIQDCDLVLSVLDAPGEGVLFELGVAYALNKPIIAFRSDRQSYLGKVIEGLWLSLPRNRKARSLSELTARLADFSP